MEWKKILYFLIRGSYWVTPTEGSSKTEKNEIIKENIKDKKYRVVNIPIAVILGEKEHVEGIRGGVFE